MIKSPTQLGHRTTMVFALNRFFTHLPFNINEWLTGPEYYNTHNSIPINKTTDGQEALIAG
jgi:hypothetical protein